MTRPAFSPREQAALAALAGQIIPAPETFDQPGADDPLILADMVASGAALQPRLAGALAALAAVPGAKPLDAAGAAGFRREFPEAAELIQTLTVQCYYRDARVMRALNIAVRPPFPRGYTQAPNDLSLLDPVRKRGEIYRKPR